MKHKISHFKKGVDQNRFKPLSGRWSDDKRTVTIKRLTKDVYDSLLIQDNKSNVLLCGAVDKKIPATMTLRPSKADKTPIEQALMDSAKAESDKNELRTYRIFQLGKTADMFFETYSDHRFWDGTCQGKLNFDLKFDKQMGLGWCERLKCLKCGFVGKEHKLYETVNTNRPGPKVADINLSVAVGLMDTKSGPNDFRYLMTCLKIPPPSYSSMQSHSNIAADKVSEVAHASFNRARQQVRENNVACGFEKDASIPGAVDSQYNNSLKSAGETTPMQPATQVSTTIIEMQTNLKKVIGMHIGSKLCSHSDHSACNARSGCSKNLQDTDQIGDEHREARLAMESILKSDTPITTDNMTTDGDSKAFKGARAAQLAITGKPMSRMADVVHLTKTMKNKIKRTEFSQKMFPGHTKRDRAYIQKRFAKDVSHRVLTEFQNVQQSIGDTNIPCLQQKCENLKMAIIDCYQDKCGKTCRKYSMACGGNPPISTWRKYFMPTSCKPLKIQGDDKNKLIDCLNVRLGKDAVTKTCKGADTNKLEALHRGINASNPKDVTFRRNAKGRKLSAAERLNDGRANSAIEKVKTVGGSFPQNTKVLRSLKKIQDKNTYDKHRQMLQTYKTARFINKVNKFKVYDDQRQHKTYSTDLLDK